jgi:hypothetical protein
MAATLAAVAVGFAVGAEPGDIGGEALGASRKMPVPARPPALTRSPRGDSRFGAWYQKNENSSVITAIVRGAARWLTCRLA